MPLPLSFAASAGYARLLFRAGLTFSAVMMTFALPETNAAYRHLIATRISDDYSRYYSARLLWGVVHVLPLYLFMYLTMIGFFLQALVPFNKEALEPLRRTGNLMDQEFPLSARNKVHSGAAGLFFASCFMMLGFVVAVSVLSVLTEEVDLHLSVWSKLFLPPPIFVTSFILSLFLFGRSEEGVEIDAGKKRCVRVAGAFQIGILCSILSLLLMVASDVRQICAARSSACEATAFDMYVMNAVLFFFVLAVCTIGMLKFREPLRMARASLDYVELAC